MFLFQDRIFLLLWNVEILFVVFSYTIYLVPLCTIIWINLTFVADLFSINFNNIQI